MDYKSQLSHPLWQRKRLEIYHRDNFSCVLCSDTETELHVHHKKYKYGKDAWDYPNDNFQTLCRHCHCLQEYLKDLGMECLLSTKISIPSGDILISGVLNLGGSKPFVQFYLYNMLEKEITHILSVPDSFLGQLNKLQADFKNIING